MKGKISLHLLGFPPVQNLSDLSTITGFASRTLYHLSRHAERYYKTYEIPKKSGGKRVISQPGKKLKSLQRWILSNILNKASVSPWCKGFRKGCSTLDNAQPHIAAKALLNIDLKDFFPTVSSRQVYHVFTMLGYNPLIATVFTNICTYKGKLPQGSPCSPMLANLVTWKLDLRISGYVEKRQITYTRYADDLSFSGQSAANVAGIIPMVESIIRNENFEVNPSKTRMAGKARQKKVTGLVMHADGVGIGKQQYKTLRAKIHHLTRPADQSNEQLFRHTQGWLSYLNSVDAKRYQQAKEYIHQLSNRYPGTLVSRLR